MSDVGLSCCCAGRQFKSYLESTLSKTMLKPELQYLSIFLLDPSVLTFMKHLNELSGPPKAQECLFGGMQFGRMWLGAEKRKKQESFIQCQLLLSTILCHKLLSLQHVREAGFIAILLGPVKTGNWEQKTTKFWKGLSKWFY